MSLGRVLLVRRAVADVAVHDDQGGPMLLLAEDLEGACQEIEIVGVADSRDVPAVALEARRDVVLIGDLRVAVDRDVVVVVDPAEVRKPEVSGDRRRFARDALH